MATNKTERDDNKEEAYYYDGPDLKDFLVHCSKRRELKVGVGHEDLQSYRVIVDRFTSLWEIRFLVACGQDELEGNSEEMDRWPTWRRLFFVLDNGERMERIRMEREKRVIVWDMMERGYEVGVREADRLLIKAGTTVTEVFVNNDEMVADV